MAKTIVGKACKLFSVIVAAIMLAGCVFMFTACESKNPEIKITIEFNDKNYEIEYKLSRSFAPQTVAHYIELIDLDYFNNTVIHDYKDDDRMIGGGFTYEGGDMDGGDVVDDLVQLDYDGATTENGSVTLQNISLWEDAACETPSNRLFGETSSNGARVENGSFLSNSFGSLGAYTYAYDSRNVEGMREQVYTPSTDDSAENNGLPYYRNSFQGMFYIYTSTSTSESPNYCVFGELKDEDSETVLNDLLDAIDTYLADNELESFTEEKNDSVILDSMIPGGEYDPADNFDVPVCRIIIRDISVTKY